MDIYREFLACEVLLRKGEDEIYIHALRAIRDASATVDGSLKVTSEDEINSVTIVNDKFENNLATNEKTRGRAVKCPKLSIHAKRCQHSPHNRSKAPESVCTPKMNNRNTPIPSVTEATRKLRDHKSTLISEEKLPNQITIPTKNNKKSLKRTTSSSRKTTTEEINLSTPPEKRINNQTFVNHEAVPTTISKKSLGKTPTSTVKVTVEEMDITSAPSEMHINDLTVTLINTTKLKDSATNPKIMDTKPDYPISNITQTMDTEPDVPMNSLQSTTSNSSHNNNTSIDNSKKKKSVLDLIHPSPTGKTPSPSVQTSTTRSSSSGDNRHDHYDDGNLNSLSDEPSQLNPIDLGLTNSSILTSESMIDMSFPMPSQAVHKPNQSFAANGTSTLLDKNKGHHLSLGNSSIIKSSGALRPFLSSERLGGTSRLATLTKTESSAKAVGDTKLNRISEKGSHAPPVATTTTTTNLNRSTLNKSTSRPASIMAEQEQRLQAKKQKFISEMEKREERLRAFQEAQKQKIEARKKANEERHQAVKIRAQRMLLENQQQLAKEKARVDLELQKMEKVRTDLEAQKAAATSRKQLTDPMNKSKGKENIVTVPQRPLCPDPLRTAMVPPTLDTSTGPKVQKHATVVLQSVPQNLIQKTPQIPAPQKPLLKTTAQQPSVPRQPTVSTTTTVQKPTHPHSTAAAPMNSTTASSAHRPAAQPHPPAGVKSPIISESYDLDHLRSDSDSDDDDHQPSSKVPLWSRKGNPELIAIMTDIYSGKLRWQQEFLPATNIEFDIKDVFRNYDYTIKPRTSSGIWNTPPIKNNPPKTMLKRGLL